MKYKYETIADTLREEITGGKYKAGDKLPSVRELKSRHQSSVTTIQMVYESLIVQGLVESVPKSGYYVSEAIPPILPKHQAKKQLPDVFFRDNLAAITKHPEKQWAEFNVAMAGDLLVPQKLILRTMQHVIREKGTRLLRYYPSNGSEELRIQIAAQARQHAIFLNPENLIITDGALQALYIALSAVCMSNDIIAVESPCVFSVLEVIRMLGLSVIEIPVDPEKGFDIDFLEAAIKDTPVKAVVLTPNFHNPTGKMLSDTGKKKIIAIAVEHSIAIIENDIYGDLNFSGDRPRTIQSWDESGLVLTFSSYSKTLAGGIRLGWLSPGRFFEKAEQLKFSLGSTVAPVYQETVCRLLETKSYDRHIRRFRMQLAKQARQAIVLLGRYFPEHTFFVPPQGGYAIWVRTAEGTDMQQFYAYCEALGIRFTPGTTFSLTPNYSNYFRIVFADAFTPLREKALKAAGKGFRDL
ncbi:PLP-dependent aminotransferase family protein [Flavobacterium kingsejongi]|uniref:GntR family transcriptional regulator n=1 Tax=Flavobacterium kingsejongi TaxID=1678728 RepID=A0A2S1LP58_9FLAO|nr:PLP-dependent aminotransferase family protein [Flavobacterium kingsejongi]AWG25524.1 GntR family transcriptional regulator [Flavobacterium kingsejongi]